MFFGNKSFILLSRSHTLGHFLFDHISCLRLWCVFTPSCPIRLFYAQALGDPWILGVLSYFFKLITDLDKNYVKNLHNCFCWNIHTIAKQYVDIVNLVILQLQFLGIKCLMLKKLYFKRTFKMVEEQDM